MKKHLKILLLALIIIPGLSSAQDFWEPIPYPDTEEPMSCFAMDGNGRLFACNQENVFYTDDLGQNWFSTSNWPGYYPKSMIVNSIDYVFIATFNNGVYRSMDGGVSFQESSTGLNVDIIRCLALLENDHLLLGTSDGLFRSVDHGDTWDPYGAGLPDDWVEEISVGEAGKLLAGTLASGIYRSYNYGENWSAASGGLPDTTQVTTVLTVPGTDEAYAGLYPQGMFYSSDDGDNWMEYNDGLPFTSARAIHDRDFSLHGLNKIQQLIFVYVYAHIVLYNEIYGYPVVPWNPLFGGIPEGADVNVFTALVLTMAICGTMSDQDTGPEGGGPGIYINAVPVGIISPAIPDNKSNLTVFRCPGTRTPTIRVSLAGEENVSLNIYNLTGQMIACMKQGILSDGIHDFRLNDVSLPAGLYLAKLDVEGRSITRKLIVP